MAKVTSKLQITIPKASAEAVGIRAGDEVQWLVAGGSLRLISAGRSAKLDLKTRLRLFDESTRRCGSIEVGPPRDWSREDLYDDSTR